MLTNCETLADDERVFLIDQSLQFRFGTLDGDATCSWKDLSGEEGDLWEFVSSKVCARLQQLCLHLLTKTYSLFPEPRIHCSSLLSYIACLSGYTQNHFVIGRANWCIEIFTLTRGSHGRTAPSTKIYWRTRHSKSRCKTKRHCCRGPTVVTWLGRSRGSFSGCPYPSPGFRRLICVWHRNRAFRHSRI